MAAIDFGGWYEREGVVTINCIGPRISQTPAGDTPVVAKKKANYHGQVKRIVKMDVRDRHNRVR